MWRVLSYERRTPTCTEWDSMNSKMMTPNHALQRTAAGRRGCNRCALWPPSLILGRWAEMRIWTSF
jgi:hypothetical protein